ncbi:MAG: DUF308 domain-containing protein [Lachnospiraceae bacterium]|nr:DUF308 domain-containing protein [Lachnospiraceae bacterium]
MEKFKKIGSGVAWALCELVVGISLLIDPVSFTPRIIMVAGAILTVVAAINIVRYFRNAPPTGIFERKLSAGLIEVICGIFCVTTPQWFAATFPALAVIYGVATLMSGVMKVELTVNMLRMKVRRWWISAIGAAVTIACAVFIICNPLNITAVLWTFIAISLIVEAVIDLVTAFLPARKDPNEV